MKSKSKSTSDDDDGTTTRSFDVLMDPNDPDSDTYSMKVPVFEDGTAEDWVTWRIMFSSMESTLETPLSSSESLIFRQTVSFTGLLEW